MTPPARSFHSVLAASALLVLSACASAPAATGPAATALATAAKPAASTAVAAVSPVATQVAAAASPAATAIAAASPGIATAVTAASPAIATVAAAASPAAAAASPIASAVAAASPVRIIGARLDPTDTTMTVQNVGSAAVDLAGWRLRIGTATAALPSGTRVGPNESLTIHTAAGTNAAGNVYLGPEATALIGGMRPGASVALVDAQGNVASEFMLPG